MELTGKERIKAVIRAKGILQKDFEKSIDVSNGYINSISKSIGADVMRKINKVYPDINSEWLLTGEGEMFDTVPAVEISYTDGVPYYDEFFECGFDELSPSTVHNPDFLVKVPGYGKATLWCNASGQSMAPEINNGDLIAMQRVDDLSLILYGDIYGIVTSNGLRTIKRIGRSDLPGHVRLIPTNKECDSQDIPTEMIIILYKVLGALKKF